VDPRLPSKIYQGITTEITGEGGSAAPLNDTMLANDRPGYAHYKVEPDWRTFRQYFARLEKQGMGINLASYVGATQVRRMVLGDADVQPTPEQLEKMKALVREAMRDGAVGVSTALEYAPAPYSKTEEIIALASEASKFGGIYATHMRNEGSSVLEAIDEAVRIGREAHIPVEIWHFRSRVRRTGDTCPSRLRGSIGRALKASMSRPIPMLIPRGSTACRLLFRHGRTTAAMPNSLSGSKTPPLAPAFAKTWRRLPKTGITSGKKSAAQQDVMIGVVQNPELRKFQGKRLTKLPRH